MADTLLEAVVAAGVFSPAVANTDKESEKESDRLDNIPGVPRHLYFSR